MAAPRVSGALSHIPLASCRADRVALLRASIAPLRPLPAPVHLVMRRLCWLISAEHPRLIMHSAHMRRGGGGGGGEEEWRERERERHETALSC